MTDKTTEGVTHTYQSPFRLQAEEYERDIDIVEGYIEQTAHYIHTVTGDPIEVCADYVINALDKGGDLEHTFPRCKIYVRNQKTGDREERHVTIDKLFRMVIEREIINSPSLTFYLPEKIKRSKLSEFMEMNVKKRGVVKGQMFDAKAAGDKVLEVNKKNEQNAVKTLNNGSSGAFSSPYTILFNMTSHSALTSTCRTATSFGNSANERLMSGTRHYATPAAVINHFLSICTLTNLGEFQLLMEEHGLHYPTVEETLDVIKHSTELYYINKEGDEKIADFIAKSKPLERAAFVYSGDFYHLAKYNDAFMREMFRVLISPAEHVEIQDYAAAEKTIDGDMKIILSQLCGDIMGVGSNFGKVKDKRPDDYKLLIEAGVALQRSIGKYAKFVRVILSNKNLPPRIANMPEAIRRVGVVSDTDSTMMTAQWWAEWYTGGSYGNEEATRVSDMIIYLSVQHMSHLMASMSVNMGVAKNRIFLYAMKNEFKFSSFSLTTKAKHYFALITSQEGTIYTDAELEVKGVSLRTSNIPPIIMSEFRKTVKRLCEVVANEEKIELLPVLERVAEIERSVIDSVMSSDSTYLKTVGIKSRDAYSDEREGNYHYHRFYSNVWAKAYGELPEPPYDGVKLPVNLNSKTEITAWVESIENAELRIAAERWFEENPKRKYTTLILPEPLIANHGIPKELLPVIDARRTAFSSVEPYYHMLETLGVFAMDKDRTRLLSDYYTYTDVEEAA